MQPSSDHDEVARPRKPLRERRLMVSAAVALCLLAALTLAGRSRRDVAPYGVAAVSPSAHLMVVPSGQAQQRIDELAGANQLTAVRSPGDVIVGQLAFSTPLGPRKPGQYAVFIVDNDSHQLVSGLWGVSPGSDVVRSGFASAYSALIRSSAWPLPPVTGPESAISFIPGTASPVTFEATLPAGAVPITDPHTQLSVVFAFFAPDAHLYWVTKIPA